MCTLPGNVQESMLKSIHHFTRMQYLVFYRPSTASACMDPLQGFLAEEGNYDRMEAMLKVLEPVDAILLLAASQNDTPKIIELIQNGANLEIKGLDGKTAAELATKPETQEILRKGKVAA